MNIDIKQVYQLRENCMEMCTCKDMYIHLEIFLGFSCCTYSKLQIHVVHMCSKNILKCLHIVDPMMEMCRLVKLLLAVPLIL